MTNHITLETDQRGVCTISLNRPEKHNAFNAELISELTVALQNINNDHTVRVAVITGAGESFSSGADLNWMRESANYDKQQNIADAQQLSQLMRTLYDLCKPSIAKINGQAFGGALGLIACCDIAIATSTAQFAFTEARLGLAPAVISPYILMSIGPRQARRLFLTAERFGSPEAEKMELIHRSVFPDELNSAVEAEIKHLLKAGPESIKACKALIPRLTTEQIEHELVELIATLRTSPEGQEGLNAFFEKRNPAWIKK